MSKKLIVKIGEYSGRCGATKSPYGLYFEGNLGQIVKILQYNGNEIQRFEHDESYWTVYVNGNEFRLDVDSTYWVEIVNEKNGVIGANILNKTNNQHKPIPNKKSKQ